MAYNNTIILTGNIGAEVKLLQGKKEFASLSLATQDSYKDKEGNWIQKDSIWHNILLFNPLLIEQVKAFKKGTRIKLTGSIYYRPFEVTIDGETVTKNEATIIAGKIEQAPLYKKTA